MGARRFGLVLGPLVLGLGGFGWWSGGMGVRRWNRRVLVGAAAIGGAWALRRRSLRWGATQVELAAGLPGDGLLPRADLVATRGITVRAEADAVWPWIAQLGWRRGGFYSYDALENLIGLQIHSADEIVPRWQDIAVGDRVHLAEQVALDVLIAEPGRALVLAGAAPQGPEAAPVPYDFTWAFVLRPGPAVGTTRLVVRERYACRVPWARPMVEMIAAVSLVMSERMLRGIRDRAERVD